MQDDNLNILLLCNRPARNADASTVTDHLDAFLNYSRHRVFQLSFLRRLPGRVDLDRFDAIVIHYSIAIGYLREHYINDEALERLRDFSGLKVVFIQDEYRSVNAVLETLNHIKADVLFTCVPEPEIGKVYGDGVLPGITKINTLTGYIARSLVDREVPPIAERAIDVGYRTRKPPYWLGELGVEKWQISDRFEEHVDHCDLNVDLSYDESDRLYGKQWTGFVSSCKVMLGVESGASVFDFTGALQKTVDEYVVQHPDATFAEVQDKFLRPHEGRIRLNQISPRCFEAAALRTAMLLYEGEYSGILKPWRHYIPLKKDFGNFDEVLATLKNVGRLQEIADCAYQEVAQNPAYTYETFIGAFDDRVMGEYSARGKSRAHFPYSRAAFWRDLAFSMSYFPRYLLSRALQRVLLGTRLRRLIFKVWGNIPFNGRNLIRPLLRIIGR